MTHNDFEREPIPGLPARLPEGEHIVWQGSPERKAFARNMLHQRKIMAYFAVIAVWKFSTGLYDGEAITQSLMTVASIALGAGIVLAIIHWYSKAIERTTIYTITNKRVVMRFGVALPVTFNFPYAQITAANVKPAGNDTGSITLGLKEHTKISWAILWPHVRPWKLAHPEPALRMIDGLENVSGILAKELHMFHEDEMQHTTTVTAFDKEQPSQSATIAGLSEQGA